MHLERDHLVVLLNALYEADVETIAVEHPCDTIGELCRIDLGPHDDSTVVITQGPGTYDERRDAVRREYGDRPYEDLPDRQAYVKAFVGGGLVEPENADELDAFLDRYTHPDLSAGHDPVLVAYDTNLFGFRLPEQLGVDPVTGPTDEADRPPTNGYALAGGVREELDWHYAHYSTHRLEAAFGQEFERLADQPAGSNRAGLLGLYEFRGRMADRAVDVVPSEAGDEQIVEAYGTYDETNRKRVLLLSNDYGFVERAQERGLWAHHVAFPVDTPRSVRGSWREIADTLYLLTVLFGVLQLPKVTLYGVWDGKSGLEWQHERLDVDVRSPVVEPILTRNETILRAFEGC